MLVDVVRMRLRGERLPEAELKTIVPVRGKLGVFVRMDAHRNQSVVCAMLEGDGLAEARIPGLDHMRLTKVRGENFVLIGFEEVRTRKSADVYPQAWWCRLVHQGMSSVVEVDEQEVGELASVF